MFFSINFIFFFNKIKSFMENSIKNSKLIRNVAAKVGFFFEWIKVIMRSIKKLWAILGRKKRKC